MIFKLCDDHYSVNFIDLFTFNFRFDGTYPLSQNWGDEASPRPAWYTQWALVTRIRHKRNEKINRKKKERKDFLNYFLTLFCSHILSTPYSGKFWALQSNQSINTLKFQQLEYMSKAWELCPCLIHAPWNRGTVTSLINWKPCQIMSHPLPFYPKNAPATIYNQAIVSF